MSDVHTDTTSEDTQAAAATAATPAEKPFTVGDLEKMYFAPDDIGTKGTEYLSKVTALGLDMRTNFDPTAEFPTNFGLYLIPLQKRSEKEGEGNITIGVAVTAVPHIDMLAADTRGPDFILQAVLREYEKKIVASIRPRSDGKLPAESAMPRTLDDFVENRREKDTFGAYSELAKLFVPELKKKMPWITPVTLRQCLQSKQYAQSFQAVSDEFWNKLLDVLIAKGTAKGMDVSVLVNWKETRDETTIDAAKDVDLDALSLLIN